MKRLKRDFIRKMITACFIAAMLFQVFLLDSAAAEENDSNKTNMSDEERPEYLGMKLYRGEFHAHTSISDGVLMPKDAFEYVQEHTVFDFYGLAEHDVTFDISSGNDYLEDFNDSYSEELKMVHNQHNDYNTDSFATIPGIEVTWYDQAGHLNLYNTDWFTRTYGKGADGTWGMGDLKYDLPTFYGRVVQDPNALVQLNHPDSEAKGDFFGFKHFNKEIDKQVTLFEYKISDYFDTYIKSLDQGWHLSPTWSGDEHTADWGAGNPALTGVWTENLSRESILDAMRNRRTYSTFDENTEITYSANSEIMGSILPGNTDEVDLHISIKDKDKDDLLENVTVYTNEGKVAKQYNNVSENNFEAEETLTVQDGDYYFVKAVQQDGDEIISAPIWIGEETRGTDYAPEISISEELPKEVKLGDTVSIPAATATDDSGESPSVKVEVFDSKGAVEVADNAFTVNEYGEYFVRYYATDSQGNSRVELIRILVDDRNLDGDKILNEFMPIANVGATEKEVGITLVTDKVLDGAYIQYKPSSASWDDAELMETKVSYFESAYGENVATSNYRILASHEADLSGLELGTSYDYRFGLTETGSWSDVHTFNTKEVSDKTTMYVLGDLQVPDRNVDSFKLFRNMVNVVQEKNPDGNLMVQVGDLVNRAGMTHEWTDAFDHIYKDLGLLSANMIGNHEVMQDADASSFTHFFNLPENGEGSWEESNYSFDYGDVHIAVLNSENYTNEQLEWLEKDMRSTDKKWKVVVEHYPYYGGSHTDDPGMSTGRAQITKMVQQLGVNLHVGGHDHVYKRTTIRDGEKNTSQEAMNLGTTFITMGSSGPKFYEDEVYDWDHISYDEDKQTGAVLEADDETLTWKIYNSDGEVIDEFTLTQPEGHADLTSVDVENGLFNGIGVLNYPGSSAEVTVVGAVYDQTGTKLIDSQVKQVELEGLGREQLIEFDQPIEFSDQHTVKLFVWDNLKNQQPVFPSMVVRESMDGEGTAENPYRISSISDFDKIQYYPDKHYVLTNDIDGTNETMPAIGGGDTPFSGVFDGNGHSITGLAIDSESGAGLFRVNNGTIKNLAVLDATINSDVNDVGILVDVNNGTIENSYTTGKITGESNVGGLVGYSNSIVRNSYSTATVKANVNQAGGIIGITNRGSITENTYSTGSVTAGGNNAGGLSGYGYNDTTIQNSAALNKSVITTAHGSRIVGRVKSNEAATLSNNVANANMMVTGERVTEESSNNRKGLGKSVEELKTRALYEQELGWDFDTLWTWSDEAGRPVLQMNKENADQSGSVGKPNLEQDDEGHYLISTVADLMQINDFPNENYRLANDIDLNNEEMTPLAVDVPFMGVLDGNGKKLYNFKSDNGALIHLNGGTIQNIAMVGADVTGSEGAAQTGILVNVNNGVIENSYTTGKVSGDSTVGGVIGYSNGTIRNSYSHADVIAANHQAGGIIGITNTGSVTENVYATGDVRADGRNAGGITGYGYNDTVVKNVMAVNNSVTATSFANRVVGRVYSGHVAQLENNFAYGEMVVAQEQITEDSPTSERGSGKTLTEVQNMDTYKELLGWDFENVWEWDEAYQRPVLKMNAAVDQPDQPVAPKPDESPSLEVDENEFYQVTSIADLEKVNKYPEENYVLTTDLDFANEATTTLDRISGVFDGAGHVIKNYQSDTGGFIKQNTGTIKNLAVLDADIQTTASNVGIMVDQNDGIVENSYTTGQIVGGSTVGGLIGYSNGDVKNSYSTATVKATSKQAGGLIGITNEGSTTTTSYATGSVTADSANAGGISGYGYNDTEIQHTVALNPSVVTTSHGSRIVGRVRSGHQATLINNLADKDMVVSAEVVVDEDPNNRKGLGKSAEELTTQALYEEELGWNFESVWIWDEQAKRPVLQANQEDTKASNGSEVPLSQDENGAYVITSVKDLAVMDQFPAEDYILQNNLEFAGESIQLAVNVPFTGTFDGKDYQIKNFQSTNGALFHLNAGTIKNVGMVEAEVSGGSQIGILVNQNDGVIENSYSTGVITGADTIGGLVGYSNETVKNSYSKATVTAIGNQAGGLIGITNTGSVTENVYATGKVTAEKNNAGGITGYGYNRTVVRNAVALNPSVTAVAHANRIVGRVRNGHQATLEGNLALDSMVVEKEEVTEESSSNEKGTSVTQEEVTNKLFSEKLGWDFETVWNWNESSNMPQLD